MTSRSPITTHILDTALGKPAAAVTVRLFQVDDQGGSSLLAQRATNVDGRVEDLLPPGALAVGNYRLVFEVASYFANLGATCFYPQVTLDFSVSAPAEHYHVPLLLSPYGYSTYRGS